MVTIPNPHAYDISATPSEQCEMLFRATVQNGLQWREAL